MTYAADVTAIGLSMSLLWWYASHRHRLVDPALPSSVIRAMTLRAIVAPMIFLLSIPVALVSPFGAMAIWWISPLVAVAVTKLFSKRFKARYRRGQ